METRESFWNKKFEDNKKRDLEIKEKIKDIGWKSVIIWECEINNLIKDSSEIINKLKINL